MIKAGCCGFAAKGGARAYYELFDVVELQSTFYKLPRVKTVEKWRKESPKGFEFVVKAWQAITHPPSSPTWRKCGSILSAKERGQHGHLKPTSGNIEAWKRIVEICRQLNSRVCLVQCPPSFLHNRRNVANMKRFFGAISREGVRIAWEPRHRSWHDNPKSVRELCAELGLIHVVDILKREPQSAGPVSYIRLHGLPAELSYKYSYLDKDLELLLQKVARLKTPETYVMFNNLTMAQDCLRFRSLLSKSLPV